MLRLAQAPPAATSYIKSCMLSLIISIYPSFTSHSLFPLPPSPYGWPPSFPPSPHHWLVPPAPYLNIYPPLTDLFTFLLLLLLSPTLFFPG